MLHKNQIVQAIRHEGRLSRRFFLALGASLATYSRISPDSFGGEKDSTVQDNLFALGVASGDPDHESVVLWTRLAPFPLEEGGGMKPLPVKVDWILADDEACTAKIVQQGTVLAMPQLAHSVHVEVNGLKPDRWYFYKFRVNGVESPIGRTRTMPLPDSLPAKLNFAYASCQNYEQGLFTAYEQMLKDDLDFVFHLGDYIYEYHSGRTGKIRTHHGPEIMNLEDYRARFAQYRSDPLLHQAHARCPWFVTFDDHEFDNNCAGDISEELSVESHHFLARRVHAYQAYYEMMPLRLRSLPRGSDMMIYREAKFGRLADFMILDTRQYRTDQPNNDKNSPFIDSMLDHQATILGKTQRNWLDSKLINSESLWNVLAQQVMMGMVDRYINKEVNYSVDQWPGYAYERMDLMKFIQQRKVPNPIVLAGDIHSNWANELRVDDRDQSTPIIAAEFVGTSISSGGNGKYASPKFAETTTRNPFVKFHNTERGYVRVAVTPETWTTTYLGVEEVTKPGGTVVERAKFVVESGHSKINPA
jgi:alkaline phosphatase D